MGASHEQLYDAFGAYVRSQRKLAQLTLRQAAELARISNPYLSQIEHGLALPSIAVISALADALSVSAETMLLRAAGITSSMGGTRSSHTEDAIRQDSRMDDRQKQALLAVLASFVGSPSDGAPGDSDEPAEAEVPDEPAHVEAPRPRRAPTKKAQEARPAPRPQTRQPPRPQARQQAARQQAARQQAARQQAARQQAARQQALPLGQQPLEPAIDNKRT